MVLDGDELELVSLLLDGEKTRYTVDGETLTIADVPDAFTLETVTRIDPQKNTKLEGLYATKHGFVTQCEAQGFRRITWFIDRPDVMAATPPRCARNTRSCSPTATWWRRARGWARFEDPFPKPSYLFALVAANLEVLKGAHRGNKLSIYVEPGKLDQAGWAMDCLKRAIAWDETRFGLKLDLDEYKIVAVGDFNSGAMENKGLNIFNTSYVLARADTATDVDYLNIDRVVAHEYFHNWTGNRVTCRDWFQLSLKEGLTVFRDQEYGADTYSRAVTRIQEVRALRADQFPEDAGPMAHPVRPQSYKEIRNFYTMTVYEKGAEVVRMQHTLLGEEKFQAGMRLYFQRHDGQAVTCDDFVQAMQDASGIDLHAVQALVRRRRHPGARLRRQVEERQFLPAREAVDEPAVPHPVRGQGRRARAGAVAERARGDLHLREGVEAGALAAARLLRAGDPELRLQRGRPDRPDGEGRRCVQPLGSGPAAGFSAPVILNYPYTEDELLRPDGERRRPLQPLGGGAAPRRQRSSSTKGGKPSAGVPRRGEERAARPRSGVRRRSARAAGGDFLAEQMEVVDPDRLHDSRNALRRALAASLKDELVEKYRALRFRNPYSPDARSMGRRALRNLCLGYLAELGHVRAWRTSSSARRTT